VYRHGAGPITLAMRASDGDTLRLVIHIADASADSAAQPEFHVTVGSLDFKIGPQTSRWDQMLSSSTTLGFRSLPRLPFFTSTRTRW